MGNHQGLLRRTAPYARVLQYIDACGLELLAAICALDSCKIKRAFIVHTFRRQANDGMCDSMRTDIQRLIHSSLHRVIINAGFELRVSLANPPFVIYRV